MIVIKALDNKNFSYELVLLGLNLYKKFNQEIFKLFLVPFFKFASYLFIMSVEKALTKQSAPLPSKNDYVVYGWSHIYIEIAVEIFYFSIAAY